MPEVASTLSEFWKGKRPLFQAVWYLGPWGGAAVMSLIAFPLFYLGDRFPNWSSITANVAYISLAVFFVYYLVSVWRCAPNSKTYTWQTLSRVYVVCQAVFLAVMIVMVVVGFS
jgi:hypothetical protein